VVTPVDRFHPEGLLISAVVVGSQYLMGRLLFLDWQHRLSRRAFRFLEAVAFSLWTLIGIAVISGIVGIFWELKFVPSPVRAWESAVNLLWGFVSSAALVIYAIYRAIARRLPVEYSASRRRMLKAAGVAAIAAPAAVVGYGGIIERENYQIREVDLPVPGLHPDLQGLRIAQISDLHVSPYLSVRQAGRVVDMTNQLRPNLTLVTGDLISYPGDPLDATIAELARLRADAGVLGCLGNHEAYAMCEDYVTQRARRYGIHFLRHEATPLRWGNGVLNVAGVDFERYSNRAHYLEGAERLVLPGASNLLLSHNPDVFPAAVRQGYDVVVGGHTHGGQVTIEILNQSLNFARYFTHYVAGLYRLNGRSCYVNSGIGTIGMPVRLGAPPEITLFRLRRA
jgi:predicted MPP superfamily phosphohydrolase